jgi:hypothetical protein
MSTGFTSPIIESPVSNQAGYAYRNNMGMMNCAEFLYDMDDFVDVVASNVPANWSAAIIDTGATVASDTTVANGAIKINDATASEGAAIYKPKTLLLTSGKKFFMELRVYTDDVTDNTIQFGLSDLTATTNPEDLWTTTAANLIAFGILDGGSGYPTMLSDKSNGGTSAQAQTTKAMSASTWHLLAIHYDGASLYGYVDGQLVLTWSGASTTIPTSTALAPFIGHINGNGAGNNTVLVDYVRIVQER